MACLPWTESKYLVSMQDFVYESPNNEVWTKDNGKIHISLSILLKIVPEHEYVQQLVTNVNTINEIIDNNVTERVRALARSVETKHAYTLRGHHHAKGMLEQLNLSLSTKGILVKRVIITEVQLGESVANSMQDKTIFQFKNTLERKKFAFEQRIKNDQEETEKAKQIKSEGRKLVKEQATLSQMKKKKEIESVKAQT